MKSHDSGAIIFMPGCTVASNASHTMSFETAGYGHANIYILVGTHATNGTTLQDVHLAESDTSTSATSMTTITAFAGSNATTTAHAWTIPAVATLGLGGVIEMQVDLRKRKRYLGLVVTPGTTTVSVAALAVLSREGQSADTAAKKSAVANQVLGATHTAQCQALVTG